MKSAMNLLAGLLVLVAATAASAQSGYPDRPKPQPDAPGAYNAAVSQFETVLRQRRAQLSAHQALPNLPGQALYLARNDMISAYKDLTDLVPSRIGKPNKFAIPPAYFAVENEALLEEYYKIFDVLDAPPANAQSSDTPFKDVVDLGIAVARARGLDAANAEIAGRIALGIFFAETNGVQNAGNARSNKYKGSFQTGPSEDRTGQAKWAAIKQRVASSDPALSRRDDKEEARIGDLDHRLNHWTNVRDALMGTHADIFPQVADNREDPAGSDRPDEAVRADADHTDADPRRVEVGQSACEPGFRPNRDGISAQQQHLRLRAGRQGQNIGQLSGDSRCDVAVQCQIRTGATQVRRDQGTINR